MLVSEGWEGVRTRWPCWISLSHSHDDNDDDDDGTYHRWKRDVPLFIRADVLTMTKHCDSVYGRNDDAIKNYMCMYIFINAGTILLVGHSRCWINRLSDKKRKKRVLFVSTTVPAGPICIMTSHNIDVKKWWLFFFFFYIRICMYVAVSYLITTCRRRLFLLVICWKRSRDIAFIRSSAFSNFWKIILLPRLYTLYLRENEWYVKSHGISYCGFESHLKMTVDVQSYTTKARIKAFLAFNW